MKYWGLWGIGIILWASASSGLACVTPQEVYRAADQRNVDDEVFEQALSCQDLPQETLQASLIALGRVGGENAAKRIVAYLQHEEPKIREAAAFALGIAKAPAVGEQVVSALKTEVEPAVQYRLALALGNMGYDKAQPVLMEVVNSSESPQKVRGALQGLVNLTSFHSNIATSFESLDSQQLFNHLLQPETELEASYLMARRNLMEMKQLDNVLRQIDSLRPAVQAKMIRALANTEHKKVLPALLTHIQKDDIGIRVNAIRGLANFPDNPAAMAGILQALSQKDVISQVTALQTIVPDWLASDALLEQVKTKLKHNNSWVQSEAMLILARSGKADGQIAAKWLDSADSNLQRAAIDYFVKRKDTEQLNKLAKSDKKIIANGAQQALSPTPETAEEPSDTPEKVAALPQAVALKTTKGTIKIKLFADTPYTSTNFIRLIESGFYDNSYFHRVIPDFVAQGGSDIGDGSGTVGYSIREELSYRSHTPGTVGMATLGKDTGGAQFFINTAPNLHLDSNYTIFGEVIEGMDIAMKLEQNDRVLSAKVLLE